MELRHLRYFVAVADELHVRRAANRLGIAQPALTQQVKMLEREIGAQLLVRAGRGIALSAAGSVFHTEAQAILSHVDRAAAMARRMETGEAGLLRIAFVESASYHIVVADILRCFRATWPNVECQLHQMRSELLRDALMAGEIDAAFARQPLEEPEEITFIPVASESMFVVLPKGHRLSDRNSLSISDLAKESFIIYPRLRGTGLSDAVLAECYRAGFTPHIAQKAPQLSTTVNLVAAGMGIAIVPSCATNQRNESVCFLPLTGTALRACLELVHRRDNRSSLVTNLVATAMKVRSQ